MTVTQCRVLPILAEYARAGAIEGLPVDFVNALEAGDMETIHTRIDAFVQDTVKAIGVIEEEFRRLIGVRDGL
jgi:hypothetical protein